MSTMQNPVSGYPKLPTDLVCLGDYQRIAQQKMDPRIWHYIQGGSGAEQTLENNIQAYQNIQLVNRLLVDVSQGHTQLNLLGQTFKHPILLAPVAYQKLVTPNGELASAEAADATDTGLICSTLSSYPLEDVAKQTNANKWFQLYFQSQPEVNLDLIKRAESAGYAAIVVTLDAPIQTISNRAQQAGFKMPNHIAAANLTHYPLPKQRELTINDSIIFQGLMRDAPTINDLTWLINHTQLPVVVKGVLNPNDALYLKEIGVQAIIVSNHGGRALDCVPDSLTALSAIRQSLGADFPILVDGGIRSGYDVFKALAKGANAVLLGRMQLYGLAVAGSLGLAHLMKMMREELEFCMAMTGCPTLADIDSHKLWPTPLNIAGQ